MSSTKLKIYKQIVIECKVECIICKRFISENYINAQSIADLKALTKNWKNIKGIGAVCPNCFESLIKEEKV